MIRDVKYGNALICALYVQINSQYPSIMHVNEQLVNSENWTLN